jgi:hypothetical protein
MKNIVATDWSVPILMTDVTGKFDVEYAFEETDVGNPETEANTWFDPALFAKSDANPKGEYDINTGTGGKPNIKTLNDAIWMATRSSDDGGAHWSEWAVTRIKGNDAYIIELSNDSATVGVDVNNEPLGLKEATATSVKVMCGTKDISRECGYKWFATHCTANLAQATDDAREFTYDEAKTNYLTSFASDQNTATLEVQVTHYIDAKGTGVVVGDKVMTISKIPSTATYKLIVSP